MYTKEVVYFESVFYVIVLYTELEINISNGNRNIDGFKVAPYFILTKESSSPEG